MKIVWNYSKESEAVRILAASYHVRTRFYQKKNFCVLPYLVKKNSRVIHLPDLEYSFITAYWERVKDRSCVTDPQNLDLIKSTAGLLPENTLDYGELAEKWLQVRNEALKILERIIPGIFNAIQELEIRPSRYGSVSSSLSAWLPGTKKIIVYVRSDCDVSHIIEAILIDRLLKMDIAKNFSWEEKEAVTDFLLQSSPLKEIFSEYQPTLSHIRSNQNGSLMEKSNEYLRKLGFANEQLFGLENGKVKLMNEELILARSEQKIMERLITARGSTVSYDELADSLWEKEADDKYSLYAISKSVERLRTKVEAYGVFPDIIQTVRGSGYMLND